MAEEKVTILGTVATDPVEETAWNGTAVVKFRLATNIQRFDRRMGGYTQNQINWYTIVAFNQTAKAVLDKIRMRDRIIVTGVMKVVSQPVTEKIVDVEVEVEGIGLDLGYEYQRSGLK
jgi:single-strand DNA-binding protein